MTAEYHREYPGQASDNIIQAELFSVHHDNPCYDRRKRPDNGQEPRKYDRLPPMLLKKFLRPEKILLLKKEIVLPVIQIGAALGPEPISNPISGNPAKRHQNP